MNMESVANKSSDGFAVCLINLRKTFGPVKALDNMSIDISDGEMVALLGPSGCGKTTALRALAGLQEVESGQIIVHGIDVTHKRANKREMGMVFQSYSLFPHMSAQDNVEYGLKLRSRHLPKLERNKIAGEFLELVGLASHANHYPHQLSGGQQQRIALARALAISPRVLLLDEPLSALDAKVRSQLRDEIRRIQVELGTTTLFVTHDQEEALSIADRVGVMKDGSLQQIAAPDELYYRPETAYVAEFVGLSNAIPGEVQNGKVRTLNQEIEVLPGSISTGPGVALVRTESLRVTPNPSGEAKVIVSSFLGSNCRVQVELKDGSKLIAQVPNEAISALTPGSFVDVNIASSAVFVKGK